MIGSTVASRKREPCSALRRSCSTLRRTSPVKGEGIDFYETVKLMKAQRRALFLDRDLCWSWATFGISETALLAANSISKSKKIIGVGRACAPIAGWCASAP